MFDVVVWFRSIVVIVSAFSAGIRKFFGESLKLQSRSVETIAPILIRHAKCAVHMMLPLPRLNHRLCRAKPIFLPYNRRFRPTVGERRPVGQDCRRCHQANRMLKTISRPGLLIWFVWSDLLIWFIWLVSFNPKTKQTK